MSGVANQIELRRHPLHAVKDLEHQQSNFNSQMYEYCYTGFKFTKVKKVYPSSVFEEMQSSFDTISKAVSLYLWLLASHFLQIP